MHQFIFCFHSLEYENGAGKKAVTELCGTRGKSCGKQEREKGAKPMWRESKSPLPGFIHDSDINFPNTIIFMKVR